MPVATIGDRVWWRAARHRGGQAVVLFLLASLVTAGAAFPALYVRATEQAIVALDLRDHPADVTGLRITSRGHTSTTYASPDDTPPATPTELLGLVPRPRQHGFGTPVRVSSAFPTAYPDHPGATIGNLTSYSAMCGHLRFVRGRCPGARNEVAVTAADIRHFHLRLGGITNVASFPVPTAPPPHPPAPHQLPVHLRVVGIYQQRPSPYWFGAVLTGKSGSPDQSKDIPHVAHDDWLTVPATFTGAGWPPLPERYDEAWLPLDPARVDLDVFEGLGPLVRRVEHAALTPRSGVTISAVTGVPALLHDLHRQQAQARVIVPLTVVQLVLLALFVLWLVLAAMTGQRRPEVALALLRGRGRRGARRQLALELLPVVLAGVPVGAALAVALAGVVRRTALPRGAPLELPALFWWSVLAAAVVLVLVTAQAVHQVTRQPVESLLRRVPPRSTSRWGVVELLLLAGSATATAAFLSGGLRGAAALGGPAVLALLVGLLLSRVVSVSAVLGARSVRRGRLGRGLVLLDAARSPATRRTVAVVTVASALLVFAVDAYAVGARNRQAQAEQVVGAAAVLTVGGTDLAGVRAAVAQADPSGSRATPVVTVAPPSAVGPVTVAVLPEQFAKVAADHAAVRRLPLHQLGAPPGDPLRIRGTQVTVRARTSTLTVAGLGPGTRPHLVLGVVFPAGDLGSLDLGVLPPAGAPPRRLSATMSCSDGCEITYLGVTGAPGTAVRAHVQVSALHTDRGELPLGPPSSWTAVHGRDGAMTAVRAVDGGLVIHADTAQSGEVDMPQQWFPTTIPALVTGALPPGSDGDRFDLTGLDDQTRPAHRIGRIRRVPAAAPDTALVNLETVSRGTAVSPNDRIQVWLASTDPGLRRRVTGALAAHRIRVESGATVAGQRRDYDRSASAWGLSLGRVVGALALLLAVLVLVVVAATTWRTRARDLAALALAGVPRPLLSTVVIGGQLLAITPAVLVGTGTGLLGARAALDSVPFFTDVPEVSVLDLSTPWAAALAAALAALLVLGVAGWLTGRGIATRAHLDRLRDAS